ncbi:hypothetical protein ONE63_006236 [Megalurothrips usitatus]|uniref:DUF4806 domain-containing protein n=1 Tax=Megalurothrips usitatus TaxID=439358 RepID=A0AAV7XSR5_9NEOP|nr:hypothetical protein ONE63_006236 [Megalurothrips usitatus]
MGMDFMNTPTREELDIEFKSAATTKDATALPNVFPSIATKNEVCQKMTPMSMNMTDLGPVEPTEVPLDLPCLPLATLAQAEEFDVLLLDDTYFKQVVLYLGALGGSDTVDTTRRVMCKLMTNRLAMAFNWAGRPPKRAFRQMRCKDLVINAVRRNPTLPQPVLESDIEPHMKRWLRYASGRNH